MEVGTRVKFPTVVFWHRDKPPIPAGMVATITGKIIHPTDPTFNQYTFEAETGEQYSMYEWLFVQSVEVIA